MDSLTHTVLGVCTGQLIAGKKLGKKALVIGAVVNNFPDLDMIANFWHSQAGSLLSHRGITHSFLFLLVVSPILALLLKKWMPRAELSYQLWLLLVAHGFILHIGLDACTAYGTGWFEPFSNYRVSFNLLFILDPFLMLPLLIVAIILFVRSSASNNNNRLATSALLLSGLYLICGLSFKFLAHRAVNRSINPSLTHFESPTAFNNLLWYVVVADSTNFNVGYYSVLDTRPTITFTQTAQHPEIVAPYRPHKDVASFLQFTKGWYRSDRIDEKTIQLSDLRFGQMMAGCGFDESFVFKFDLRVTDKDTILQQHAFDGGGAESFKALFQRLKGN